MRQTLLASALLACVGCLTFEPAPLQSDDTYRFGVAGRTYHRDSEEVVRAARMAMEDMKYRSIKQVDDFPTTVFDVEADGSPVRVEVEPTHGTTQGESLPLRGFIAVARVKISGPDARSRSKLLLDRIATRLGAIQPPIKPPAN